MTARMTDSRLVDVIFVLRRRTRQRILIDLARGAQTSQALAARLGIALSTVRANVRVLESHQLVVRADDGARKKTYRLGNEVEVAERAGEVTLSVVTRARGRLEITVPTSVPATGASRSAKKK